LLNQKTFKQIVMNKKSIFFSITLVLGITFTGTEIFAQKFSKVQLKTSEDSISYIIGNDLANDFSSKRLDVNPEVLARAIEDVQMKNKLMIDSAQKVAVINNYQRQMMAKQQPPANQELSFKNKVEGAKFLEENKKKAGIITLPSGLQYKVLRAGSGPKPLATDQVTVHYRGKLINGTIFDASYDRGEPATFGLNQVIKGWTEGLQQMQVGGKYELYIPSELGYGDQGAGEMIGPGSVLIFEIELFKINGKGAEMEVKNAK
jgi:FKBP-type peptidyl-prolyl cis-trans isomerase FklB